MRSPIVVTLTVVALLAACNDAVKRELDGQNKDERLRDQSAAKMMQAPAPQSEAGKAAGIAGGPVDANSPEESERADQAQFSPSAFGHETLTPSMIIRTGNASVEVDTLAAGVRRVRDLAQRVGGFVANTSMQAGHDQTKAATIEIRLPSSRFDEAIAGITPLGRVESVNVSAEDVGEEFVDVTARVSNAHRLEARLIEVLATKTGKLRDVLEVEREIARVREEIERMEGRLRYLRTRTSVSSLTITVHEAYPVVGQVGSSSVMGEAFKQSWRNFVNFSARFIAALGSLIPALALAIVAAFVLLKVWHKVKPAAKPAGKTE
jgi:hypothetical protein